MGMVCDGKKWRFEAKSIEKAEEEKLNAHKSCERKVRKFNNIKAVQRS